MSTSSLAQGELCVKPPRPLKAYLREFYSYLCFLAKSGSTDASNDALAIHYGVDDSTIERWAGKLRRVGLIACDYFPYRDKKRVITPLCPLKQLTAFLTARSRPAPPLAENAAPSPAAREGVPRKNEDESPAFLRSDSCARDISANLDKDRTTPATACDALPVASARLVETVVAVPVCVSFPPADAHLTVPADAVSSRSAGSEGTALSPNSVEPQMKSAVTATPPTPETAAVAQQLEQIGVDAPVARRLAAQDPEECLRQLQALPTYQCDQTLPGLLVTAITRRFRRHTPAKLVPAPKHAYQAPQPAPTPSPEALVEIDQAAHSALSLARSRVKAAAGRWRE